MRNDSIILSKQKCWYDPQQFLQTILPDKPIMRTRDGWRLGRNGSLSVRSDGCWHCFESGLGGGFLELISYALKVDIKAAIHYAQAYVGQYNMPRQPLRLPAPIRKNDRAEKIAKARAIWSNSLPLNKDACLCKHYLTSRGIVCASLSDDLRFSPSIYNHTTGQHHPTMIAAIREKTGDIIGIHQTFLTPDGHKISGEGVKAKLFSGVVKGGAIRLAPVQNIVALGEGVEDCCSIMQMLKIPAWASGSAGNIPDLPDTIREIIIAQDNDSAGVEYAQKLAHHYLAERRHVEIIKPPASCKDFNEFLIQKKATAHNDSRRKQY